MRILFKNVESQLITSKSAYLIFDDTVLDKNFFFKIELVRRQYSGNAKKVIKGIGVVTCIYVNPELDRFWLIDYRIYEPDNDGKTKLEHAQDMLLNAVHRLDAVTHGENPQDRAASLLQCPFVLNKRK